MPSKNKNKRQGLHPVTKAVIPILIAALVSLMGTAGGLIAKNIGDIRTLSRKLERAEVDKYRRTLGHYRDHYLAAKNCITKNKRILRDLPEGDRLINTAQSAIDECSEARDGWRAMVENYVEENKHMGYD